MNMQVSRHCEENMPELNALLNTISSACHDSKDVHVFYVIFFQNQFYNLSNMKTCKLKGNNDDYHGIHICRESRPYLPHIGETKLMD